MLSLTENTQRYKSLTGFAIFPCGSDIRLRLAICPLGREEIYIISHWSEATIYRTSKASISRLHSKHIAKQKRDNISATNRFVISFCRYKGLGLAHNAFDRSNAMLALSGVFIFSAKSSTHYSLLVFLMYM